MLNVILLSITILELQFKNISVLLVGVLDKDAKLTLVKLLQF